jgi:hypothetical protein
VGQLGQRRYLTQLSVISVLAGDTADRQPGPVQGPVDRAANSARAENDRVAAGKQFLLPVPPLALGLETQGRGQVRADRGDQRQRVAGPGFIKYASRVREDR